MSFPLMLAVPFSTLGPDPVTVIRRLQATDQWTFEFKHDGIRALVHVKDGVVRILNRRGVDITYRYPDVVEPLQGLPRDLVIDGEIACMDADGRPDFSRIHRRDAQGNPFAAKQLARTMPAQLIAFDVLSRDGADLRMLSYLNRRDELAGLDPQLTPRNVVIPPVSSDGLLAWDVVLGMGLEGLVAKRDDSRYTGKRSPAWVKIKSTKRLTALVSGFQRGDGSRAATFGALTLSLLSGQELVPVGSVGSGFTEADIQMIWRRLSEGDHPIMVEVEYLEVSPSGQLRQPVFRGVRRDVSPAQCTTAQLEVGPIE